ncbi:gluconate 2-dehydrogenase subunit 3 family protein [Verrucomicrobia bacterium]|nr:gluconate 2-dehydrogenase subunit 3 family protein [Verrucomicrobiota bacterium]
MKDPQESKTEFADQRLPRRDVFKWFAAFAVGSQLDPIAGVSFGAAPVPGTKGYGTDPDLTGHYEPGDFWPLTFTADQRKTVVALADLILPKDHLGPAASEVRVPDYIDEWISAPYGEQQADREKVVFGLKWLEDESLTRFRKEFTKLNEKQMRAIVDDICWPADAKAAHKKAAAFFQSFRNIAAGAYYATEPGWEAIGYVGNVALTSFNGPPPEVLKKLGVEQTVEGDVVKTESFE